MASKAKWKDQYKVLPNASQFHNLVRDIFRTTVPFKNYRCYQEVNVQDLNPSYPYNNQHYDWFIEELHTVVELHGRQHYQPVNRGHDDGDKVVRDFYRQRDRDSAKQVAAQAAGYLYVAIPWHERLDGDRLFELISEAE